MKTNALVTAFAAVTAMAGTTLATTSPAQAWCGSYGCYGRYHYGYGGYTGAAVAAGVLGAIAVTAIAANAAAQAREADARAAYYQRAAYAPRRARRPASR